ncbi:hydrogenase maturation nickel metallochaperone HypA [Sulfurimonas sp.]|uniref:hydrogenase maturation nickel metallochaperone HypA n=1 Tax=Sulfurimonas sp. TaxID=2022749 RepID=UPI002B47E4DD|nr:hydrogenase maturation nickel metallochaperone HypA [Sulfurimonas sp.]
MHEYSIVQSLLDSCEDNARENNSTKVLKVVVKIGVMSGVEPSLLQTAFDTFKEKTICEEAEFVINMQDIVIQCNNCQKESTIGKMDYCCPVCKGVDIKIIDGEDMYLMQLELN